MKKIILLLSILLVSLSSYAQFSYPNSGEGFEGSSTSLPAGWNQYQNAFGPNQFWKISSLSTTPPAICEGLNSAFIDRENVGNGNTSEDYLVTPSTVVPSNPQIKFFTRQGFTGDQGTKYRLMVSTNADPSLLSAYVLLKEWTETEMNTDFNICQEQVFDVPATYVGQNVYFAFVKVATQTGTGAAGDRWFLDLIRINSKCLAPTLGTATNVSATSATLSWTMPAGATATSWDVEVYTVAPTGIATHTGVTNSFNVTGLTPNTAYQFCVRSNCSATNQSAWVCGFNFQTPPLGAVCGGSIPVITLPYTHSENTGNIGNYYNTQQAGACGATPATTNYVAGNDVFYSYTPTFSGPISIKLTPTGPNSSVFVFSGCPTLGNCLAGVANTNSSIRVINPFVVTAGTTYYILVSSSATTPTIGYTLVIQREPCNPPVGQPVTNITTTSADLSWTNPTSATNWEYVVQPLATSSIPTGSGTPVTSNTNVTVTSLNPVTQYVYWVRSDCGGGLFSSWNGPYPFNTLICNNADKCAYTFRMSASTGAGWNGARMDVRQNGIVVATIGSTFTTGLGPVDETVMLCKNVPFDLYWTTAGTQPARCIVSVLNSFGQTLYTKPAGTSGAGQVVYGGTVNCDTPVCTIPPTGITASSITTETASISWTSPGTSPTYNYDIYVVPTGSPVPTATTTPTYANVTTNPFTISNLLHDTPYCVYVRVVCSLNSDWASFCSFTTLASCFKPTSPVITAGSITATSATFTWVKGTPTDTQWEFLLIPSQTVPPTPLSTDAATFTGASVVSPFTPTTLTQMTTYYAYVRTVCSAADRSSWTPYAVFNTPCGGTSCNYKFFPTNTAGNTWNGGRMQIKQNGIVVATIGAASINLAAGVSVSLCTGVPYELYWSVAGTAPDNIGLTIQNPFLDVIYTKAPATGTPLTVLFSDTANCTPAPCSKPTLMTAVPSATSAALSWTDNSIPPSTSFDLYIVPTGGPAPINVPPTAATISGVSNPYQLTTLNGLPLTPSTSYTYYVRANCGGTDHSAWTVLTPITFITTPLNDECINAMPVTINTGTTCVAANTVQATTYGATASLPVLTPALTGAGCGQTNKDVWFSFVAGSTSQTINLSNIVGTPAATTINHSVFSGSCTNLTKLYCSTALTSIATGLTIGQTYYIRVYTASATAVQSATFNLCITSPPANDECLNAINVPVNTGQNCMPANNVHGNTFGATTSLPALTGTGCGTSDDDVWYSFVATATSHSININSIVGTPTTVTLNHTVFSGTCGNLTKLYCSTSASSGATGLIVGQTYYVRVYTSGSTVGQSAEFDMCITSPPANDECAGAVNVPVNSNQVCTQSVSGNTLGGTPSLPALTGTGCGTSDDDVWYSFVATNNIHIIDLSGVVPTPSTATITLNHTVFSGTCPGALVKLYCSATAQSVATGLVVGQTYYVRVYTAGSTAGQSATFNICIQTPPPPATNNECLTAISVPVNTLSNCNMTTPGNLIGATASTQPIGTQPTASPCTAGADDDVWFSFVANSTREIVTLLNVAGTSTNINHAIYSGSCNNLTRLNCSAVGSYTTTTNSLIIGNTYYIRVWSTETTSQVVTFDVCVKPVSTCESATPFCGSSPANPYIYDNTTGISSAGQLACLFSTPNPTYYTLHVDQTGSLAFTIVQADGFDASGNTTGATHDVDFVCWGPFTSPTAACPVPTGPCSPTPCPNNTTNPGFYPSGTVVDCSYSASFTETLTIPNAVAGQYYVILVTNFSNQPGQIQLIQTNFGQPASGNTVCCNVEFGLANPAVDTIKVCANSVTLNALAGVTDLNNVPNANSYQWFYDPSTATNPPVIPTTLISDPTAIHSTYVATQSGTYLVKGSCGITPVRDLVVVKLTPPVVATTPQDYVKCDVDGADVTNDCYSTFDLTTLKNEVLGTLDPALYNVSYHLTNADATANPALNPISNPTSFNGTNQTIYVRVETIANTTCNAVVQAKLVVKKAGNASFTYAPLENCSNSSNPVLTISGTTIGCTGLQADVIHAFTYVVVSPIPTPPNPLPHLELDPLTGAINLALSDPGVYTISHSISGSVLCAGVSTDVTITISAPPVATFHYLQTQYCNSGITDIPVFDGLHGVLSSVPTGIIFNADGSIDLATSPAGSYTIHNYIAAANGCSDVDAIQQITISNQLVSNFSYASPVYCKDSLTSNPSPIPATGGISGTYTYTAIPTTAILDINPISGSINLSSSMAGVYTIINTIPAGNGCQQSVSLPVTVEIKELPVGTFHYPQTQYCSTSVNPAPVLDGVSGQFSSVPNTLVINATTGVVDLATSPSGTYAIHNTIAPAGGCTQVDETTQLTITTLPNATFSYSGSVYCKNSGILDPVATVAVAGGIFSYTTTTAGAILVLNPSGTIDLAASSVGDYTITYTIAAANGCPDSSTSVNVSIIDVLVATFHYPQTQYCSNSINPTPVLDGVSGQFSSVPNTLVINATTGVVDLATSPSGTYTIHNIIAPAGGCTQVDATTQLTITTLPVADFSYDAINYCKNASNPILTYVANGVSGLFSYTATPATAILDINPTTGAINLATSTAGTYSIINTIAAANGCSAVVSSAVSITITAPPVADFSYANTIYCKVTGTTPPVFIGGAVAGTFVATPSGLVINPTTGVVDLGNSAAGTYQVTNTIVASGGCAQVQNTNPVSITITAPPTGTISYSSTMCQSSTGLQTVTNTAPLGGTYASTSGLNLNPTTGAINPSASTAGVYQVTYSLPAALGCSVFTTLPVQVTIIEQSVIDFQSGCDATIYKLVAVPGTFNPVGAQYEWTGPSYIQLPNSPNTIQVNSIGHYVVKVTTVDGCTATDSFDVTSITCEIQKGISPDGDGNNDYFDLTALNVKKIEIFNRYGTSVYSLENYTTQWHGQANGGLALPSGTYFYSIEKADGVTITGWVYINK